MRGINLHLCLLRMFEDTVLLDAAHMTMASILIGQFESVSKRFGHEVVCLPGKSFHSMKDTY